MLCNSRKIKCSMRNAILLSSTAVMVAVFFVCIAAVDSPSRLPLVGLLISGAWIVLFAMANEHLIMDEIEGGDSDVHP